MFHEVECYGVSIRREGSYSGSRGRQTGQRETAADLDHRCGRRVCHEATGDSTDLVMIEKWESMEALGTHGQAEALAELGKAIGNLLAGPLDVKTFTATPAGEADQGAI